MLFTTPWFLVFSIAAFSIFVVMAKWERARRWLLLIASIIFYYHFSGMPSLLVVICLATAVFGGALLGAGEPRRRYILILSLALPILALIYFRYTGMIVENFAAVMSRVFDAGIVPDVALGAVAFVPLGISFFAFEFCHYLVDVMKGAQPIRNPLHFAIFAFFYPRMAAGPIIRFQNIIPQVEKMSLPDRGDVVFGLRRISFGFIKKFLLADPVAGLIATRYGVDAVLCGTDAIYLCLLLYVRIYMDFSSYSDMAIGLARLWGIRVPENFSFPFVSTSPSAFWRRWHISLSTWIRDYVYIPLGGARVSQAHRAFNLALAMALCGLWHGSAWHFVAWGMFHGVMLIGGYFVAQAMDSVANWRLPQLVPAISETVRVVRFTIGWVITQAGVALSWLLFFYSVPDAVRILRMIPVRPIVPILW